MPGTREAGEMDSGKSLGSTPARERLVRCDHPFREPGDPPAAQVWNACEWGLHSPRYTWRVWGPGPPNASSASPPAVRSERVASDCLVRKRMLDGKKTDQLAGRSPSHRRGGGTDHGLKARSLRCSVDARLPQCVSQASGVVRMWYSTPDGSMCSTRIRSTNSGRRHRPRQDLRNLATGSRGAQWIGAARECMDRELQEWKTGGRVSPRGAHGPSARTSRIAQRAFPGTAWIQRTQSACMLKGGEWASQQSRTGEFGSLRP